MRLMYINEAVQKPLVSDVLQETIHDLQIDKLAERLKYHSQTFLSAETLLDYYSNDARLLEYRQDIFNDFYDNDSITDVFESVFSQMARLKELMDSIRPNGKQTPVTLMKEITWYDVYIAVISELHKAFPDFKGKMKSKSLLDFFNEIEGIFNSAEFQNIIRNYEKMKLFLMEPKAVELGINLDELLKPESFFCLDLKSFYYLPPILNLSGFGKKAKGNRGIGTFLYQPTDRKDMPIALSTKIQMVAGVKKDIQFVSTINSFSHKLDIPHDKTATFYIQEKSKFILDVFNDLQLILGGVRFLRELKKYGVPVCRPVIRPENEKCFDVTEIYNPFLLESIKDIDDIVLNDLKIDHNKNMLLLVGANKGGKTTIVQAIGLTLILYHLGFNVPCATAEISPFDCILTHYQKEEDFRTREGRLGNESQLFKKIFDIATGNSFVLVNEPFMTTSPMEGELLTYEIMKIFKRVDINTIMVSHFSNLTDKVESLNNDTNSHGQVFCLSMGVDENDEESIRTYKLTDKIYQSSFSSDIVRQYGDNLFD